MIAPPVSVRPSRRRPVIRLIPLGRLDSSRTSLVALAVMRVAVERLEREREYNAQSWKFLPPEAMVQSHPSGRADTIETLRLVADGFRGKLKEAGCDVRGCANYSPLIQGQG